jgi:hypothetical protein
LIKSLLLAGLVLSATFANAANLSIDFTQTPTAFTADLPNWNSFTSDTTTFFGIFVSGFTASGSDNIAVVDPNTGLLLDTILLSFFDTGCGGGCLGAEKFGGSVVQGIDSGTAPNGYIVVNATGSPVDITSQLSLPGSVTIQVTENASSTPEPASLALFGLGGIVLLGARRLNRTA